MTSIVSEDAQSQSAFPALPCYPCPYNASCCAYGTTVNDEEAVAIQAHHGPGYVYQTRWGEWRTRVKNRRCVFIKDGACSIHDKPYYPSLCRGFPWTDAETGEPYEWDVTICGHLDKHPELIPLQRAGPSR